MKLFVYCVYDKVAETSGELFSCKNDQMAARAFNQYCDERSKQDSRFNPTDFLLLCVGKYENESVDSVFPTLVGISPYKVNLSDEG